MLVEKSALCLKNEGFAFLIQLRAVFALIAFVLEHIWGAKKCDNAKQLNVKVSNV